MVWSCLPFIRSDLNHLARHSERWKKTRQTEEELGRQYQGMDRHGVRQVPVVSGEQKNGENWYCVYCLIIEEFDFSDKVRAVVFLHGCPQSCVPNPVEDLLEVYETW